MRTLYFSVFICITNFLCSQENIEEIIDELKQEESCEIIIYAKDVTAFPQGLYSRVFLDKDLDDQVYMFLQTAGGHVYRIDSMTHSWKCDCDMHD